MLCSTGRSFILEEPASIFGKRVKTVGVEMVVYRKVKGMCYRWNGEQVEMSLFRALV
jgi:hypothetical protein